MRVPDDLDPEDRDIRLALIATLRHIRETDWITLRKISELVGVSRQAVRSVETSNNWEARTIMRHARALGWRIEWQLDRLVIPDDDDIMAIVVAAGDTSTPERADAVHWRATWNNLTRIRRATFTAVDMAARLGITDNAVHYLETNPDGGAVISAQRHARALGGRMGWRLHPHRPGRPVGFTQVMR
jgi:DNA-binding XRE family transcriptional regulator